MAKISSINSFNNNKNIIIQDLNKYDQNNNPNNTEILKTHSINIHLQMYTINTKTFPYSKGKLVFNNTKIINLNLLNSNKILLAIKYALPPNKSIYLNTKRFIIASHHYGFKEKGNKTLNILPNTPLIIQLTVKSIIDQNTQHNQVFSDNTDDLKEQKTNVFPDPNPDPTIIANKYNIELLNRDKKINVLKAQNIELKRNLYNISSAHDALKEENQKLLIKLNCMNSKNQKLCTAWNILQQLTLQIDDNKISNQQMIQKLNCNNECIICMDNDREYACIPCGHFCLCIQCKDRINNQCPICQTQCSVLKMFQ